MSSPLSIHRCTIFVLVLATLSSSAQLATRDKRWPTRGPWMWELPRELPKLYWEFNGIDFGHAHVGETLLRTQDPSEVEQARVEVLEFIFSAPRVPPDEEQVAPTLVRLVWEVQRTFNWTHSFHRSLYDLFAADDVTDKETAYRRILADYLSKPEALTFHPLDHHGKLWNWPESKAFRDKFRKFNTQIWAYHWLQAAAYDVQLMGPAARQRELIPCIIEYYHGYLRHPPEEWQMMPMMIEVAPEFTTKFQEAANIFDNLHMLHDNLDDVLSRPDLYPTHPARREQILKILHIYLHRHHAGHDRYEEFHAPMHAGRLGATHPTGPDHAAAPPHTHQEQTRKTAPQQPAKIGDEIPPGRHHTGQDQRTGRPSHPGQAHSHRQQGATRQAEPKGRLGETPHPQEMPGGMKAMDHLGPRPPSARDVLEGRTGEFESNGKAPTSHEHGSRSPPATRSDQKSETDHQH